MLRQNAAKMLGSENRRAAYVLIREHRKRRNPAFADHSHATDLHAHRHDDVERTRIRHILRDDRRGGIGERQAQAVALNLLRDIE